MKPGKPTLLVLSILFAGMFQGAAFAQEPEQPDESMIAQETSVESVESVEATPPATPDEADAAKAMEDLLGSRETAPVIEPIDRNAAGPSADVISPAASVDIDPAVLGIAPGEDPPPLVREGEFIVNRRGRLIRSPETGQRLFVFESDARPTPELPMILQPCQLLQTMEDTVDRRGEATTFILSGQVHAYRGANYLLPTMMKIAVDSGNLTN
ncbi:MAG: hypothetical protein R3C45_13445 [Phycisphaerales bacterium]